MEKWFEWIENHIFMVILIMALLIIGVPFAIYLSFRIPAPINLLEAGPEWNEGVVLGYYGSILGFLGTVILSILALYQNQMIKKEADKRAETLERQIHSPELILKFTEPTFNPNYLQFELKNISDNLANNVTVSNFLLYHENGTQIDMSNQVNFHSYSLGGGEAFTFYFICGVIKGTHLKLEFGVSCQDKFNKDLHYKAVISIPDPELFNAKIDFNKI